MDLAVVVGSCDRYSFLWEKFTARYNKYFDLNIGTEKYILSETVETTNDTFNILKCGKVPYTRFLEKALIQIEAKYIFWLQDDYYFTRSVPTEVIEESYNLINQDQSLIRVGIQENSKYYTVKESTGNFKRLSKDSEYSVSMQSSIWDREKLLDFIKNSPDETPWQFETDGSKRMNKTSHEVMFYELPEAWYQEAMKKGNQTAIFNVLI